MEKIVVDEDLVDEELPPVGLDVYQPKERYIFKYFNGEKLVLADPLILYRRVMAKINEIDMDMKAATFQEYSKADEAYDHMVVTLQKVFKIKPLEEGGLTPTELEELFSQFSEYCHYHKKKWNLIPTSQMETSDSIVYSSEGSQPIKNTSDTISTCNDPLIEKPISSPLGQVLQGVESTQEWSIGETLVEEKGKQG